MSINSPQKIKGTVQARETMNGSLSSGIIKGKDGVDGYTPVKGVDYFTEEEIYEVATKAAEIVLSSIPIAEEASF